MISMPLLVISSLIPTLAFLARWLHHTITQKGEKMNTFKFPPICSKWCSTFKHLKRLNLEPIEITRICHKCICWKAPRPSDPKPTSPQIWLPGTDPLDIP